MIDNSQNRFESEPLVTVLMPCYNAMPFLIEALDSICNQTYKQLEILCIDDGSTDNTLQILEQYAQKDNRIKVVKNPENIRLIRTLNKGIELATGAYIARMDADDIALPHRIAYSVNYLQQHPEIDMISPSHITINDDGKELNKVITRNKTVKGAYFGSFFFSSLGHPEVTLKTQILKEENYCFSEETLHIEDYELWSRLLRNGKQLCGTEEIVQQIRFNTNSVSRKFNDLQSRNFINLAAKNYFNYTGRTISKKVQQILYCRIYETVEPRDLRLALSEFKAFKHDFIEREFPEKIEKKEIQLIYVSHQFDMIYQTFKLCGTTKKLSILPLFFVLFPHIFSRPIRLYLKQKFRS